MGAETQATAPGARLPATVEAVERLGPVSHVSLRAGANALVARTDAACGLAVGQPVLLAVAMDAAQFFDAETEQALVVGGVSGRVASMPRLDYTDSWAPAPSPGNRSTVPSDGGRLWSSASRPPEDTPWIPTCG